MDQSLERWLPVAGLSDRYEVSDQGRVRSLPRVTMREGSPQQVRGKIIAQRLLSSKRSADRWQVTLITPDGRIHCLVHRLVAQAFCQRSQGCDVVNHIDNDPLHNAASNLEWTTQKGNVAHANRQGRIKTPVLTGSSNPASHYSEDQARAVIERLRHAQPRRQIASELGVSISFVAEIACGRRWKHLPR